MDLNTPTDKPYLVLESLTKENKNSKNIYIFSNEGNESEIKIVKNIKKKNK